MTKRTISLRIGLCGMLALGACGSMLNAQAYSKVDLALSYTAERANPVGSGGNFWLRGGSLEAGITVWRGLALAGNFTGTHSNAFGPSQVPLGLISYTAGPRYRFTPKWKARRMDTSLFGQALFGGVHGFDGIFPYQASQTTNAFAMQIGGGIDVGHSSRFAVRPIEADWVRLQLPNSTTNVQNDLRLSAGIVLRFGRTPPLP